MSDVAGYLGQQKLWPLTYRPPHLHSHDLCPCVSCEWLKREILHRDPTALPVDPPLIIWIEAAQRIEELNAAPDMFNAYEHAPRAPRGRSFWDNVSGVFAASRQTRKRLWGHP